MARLSTFSGSAAQAERADERELAFEPKRVIAGKYVLEEPAGFGGMAQLWVATNKSTGAEVCVKIMVRKRADDAIDDENAERFRREAYAAARLSHRAIVRVFDLVELDEQGNVSNDERPHALAIVMELLRGETLGDLLCKRGRLPLDEALDTFLPIVSALAYAHRANVIHRDVKPDNIFLAVDPDGHMTPKILDFGVSKLQTPDAEPLTFDGVLLGTPSFMSPEQAKGARRIDARSDVFSAGIVLYMALSGGNPFDEGEGAFDEIVRAILERHPPRLHDVPAPIWEVIERALAKDPDQRYADATELGIALRRASGRKAVSEPGIPARLPVDSAVYSVPPVGASVLPTSLSSHVRPTPYGRRRMTLAISVSVAGVLLVLASAFALLHRGGTSEAAPRSPASAEPQEAKAAVPSPPPIEIAAPDAGAKPAASNPSRGAKPKAKRDRPAGEPKNARDPGF